jgi:hypothetical protein
MDSTRVSKEIRAIQMYLEYINFSSAYRRPREIFFEVIPESVFELNLPAALVNDK